MADLCSRALRSWSSFCHLHTAGAVLNAAALAGGGVKQSATTAAPGQLQRSMVLASHTMVGLATAAVTRGAAGKVARHPAAVKAAVAEPACRHFALPRWGRRQESEGSRSPALAG